MLDAILNDPKFWLAVSFLIFVALIIKYVMPIITRMIDNKKQQVADAIAQSYEMKAKAEELLSAAEKYHQDSIANSKQLIADAKSEAESLINDSQKAVAEELSRKLALCYSRIKQEEDKAVREVKNKIITLAIESFEKDIANNKDEEFSQGTVDKAIGDISKLIH